MTKYILVLLGLFCFVGDVQAKDWKSPNDWFEQFCALLPESSKKAAAHVVDAMDFGGLANASQLEDQKLTMQSSFERSENAYGKLVSCSVGHEVSVGEDLKRVSYVAMYPLKPIVINGHFVKRGNEWKLFSMDFVDEAGLFPYK